MEFEENELIGKSIGIVCSKELIKPMDNLLRKDFIRNTKAVFFTKSHREIPVCLSTSIIQDNEKITGIVCMLQVTNKHNLMEEINSKIFEHCAEAIIITDSQSNILDANPAYTKLTGYNKEEVIGQNPRVLKSNHHNVKFYQNMWKRLIKKGEWKGEIWDRRKNGELYPKWLTISSIKNENGENTHYIGIFTDLTIVKQNEKELYKLANYDLLTKLPNRILFQGRLQQYGRYSHSQ